MTLAASAKKKKILDLFDKRSKFFLSIFDTLTFTAADVRN